MLVMEYWIIFQFFLKICLNVSVSNVSLNLIVQTVDLKNNQKYNIIDCQIYTFVKVKVSWLIISSLLTTVWFYLPNDTKTSNEQKYSKILPSISTIWERFLHRLIAIKSFYFIKQVIGKTHKNGLNHVSSPTAYISLRFLFLNLIPHCISYHWTELFLWRSQHVMH